MRALHCMAFGFGFAGCTIRWLERLGSLSFCLEAMSFEVEALGNSGSCRS